MTATTANHKAAKFNTITVSRAIIAYKGALEGIANARPDQMEGCGNNGRQWDLWGRPTPCGCGACEAWMERHDAAQKKAASLLEALLRAGAGRFFALHRSTGKVVRDDLADMVGSRKGIGGVEEPLPFVCSAYHSAMLAETVERLGFRALRLAGATVEG